MKNSAPGDPPVLLCGLKLDLEERRAVPTQEASVCFVILLYIYFVYCSSSLFSAFLCCLYVLLQRFASKYRMKFVETSAKEDIGVEKAFLELAEVVLTET